MKFGNRKNQFFFIVLAFAVIMLSYYGGNFLGQNLGYENGFQNGKLQKIRAYKDIASLSLTSDPFIFVNKNNKTLIPISFILNEKLDTNQSEIISDTFNISLLHSISQFIELDKNEENELFKNYYSIQDELISNSKEDYASFLYNLEGVDLTDDDYENAVTVPISKVLCTLVNILSPIAKQKLLSKSLANTKKVTVQDRIEKVGKNYVRKQICNVVFENAIDLLITSFKLAMDGKKYIPKIDIIEENIQAVSKLVSDEFDFTVNFKDTIHPNQWLYRNEVDNEFNINASIGCNLETKPKIQLSSIEKDGKTINKLSIILVEPKILDIYVEPSKMDNGENFKDYQIFRIYNKAHNEAINEIARRNFIEKSKANIALQMRRFYEPIIGSGNHDYVIDVQFEEPKKLKN